MEPNLWATAGLLLAGAITPGPNNLVVLRQAARRGWRGALPAIAGILAGTLVLLLLASVGIGALLTTEPRLVKAIAAAGSAYLVYLGGRLLAARPRTDADGEVTGGVVLPAGFRGLAAFQFVNPKAWLVVLTVTASAQARLGPVAALPPLIALFGAILGLCLGLWSWLGVALQRRLRAPGSRLRFDRTMGALLVASALFLLAETWR